MSRIRIVLANSTLAGYPEAGGHWTCFLQHLLGLHALGHDVFWLELLRSQGDESRDRRLIGTFFTRMRAYGVEDRCILLHYKQGEETPTLASARPYGESSAFVEEIMRSADLLWNYCAALCQPLLSLCRRRVFIDLDPGLLQIAALTWDLGLRDHYAFLTVGAKMRDADCGVPALGLTWHPFPPVVYLPMWEASPDPGPLAPFTSVTQWTWEEVWLDKRVLSTSKRDAYLQHLALPGRAGRPFELAANIHPADDTGDRELLQSHGWKLAHPHEVAGSPLLYQEYIRRSRAEVCCPKPIYRELKTGWLSDRSACYLASGRPVLAQDTGFSDHFPARNGLVAFQDLDEAVVGVADIDSNYERHSRAARAFAEEFLDSRRCLERMLARCG